MAVKNAIASVIVGVLIVVIVAVIVTVVVIKKKSEDYTNYESFVGATAAELIRRNLVKKQKKSRKSKNTVAPIMYNYTISDTFV